MNDKKFSNFSSNYTKQNEPKINYTNKEKIPENRQKVGTTQSSSTNKNNDFNIKNIVSKDLSKQNDNDNLFLNFKNSSLIGGSSSYTYSQPNTKNLGNSINLNLNTQPQNKIGEKAQKQGNSLNSFEIGTFVNRSELSSASSNILEDSSMFNSSMSSVSGSSLYKDIKFYNDGSSLFGGTIFNSTINQTPQQIPNTVFHSITEYSYKEDQNSKFRNAMEDYSKIVDKFMNDTTKGLFCLFDGHGGSDPVKYCVNRLHEILSKNLNENKDIDKAFNTTFQSLDYELTFTDSENIGTTACVVYIFREDKVKNIICANVGDTRAVLIQKNGSIVKRISFDHKCTEISEQERIKSAGGFIINNRVFGQLVLSRALGDHSLKKYGVSCLPYISKNVGFEGDLVIIASDGIWDVISDEEIMKYSKDFSSTEEFSKFIIKTAANSGSKDNMSCIVIKL